MAFDIHCLRAIAANRERTYTATTQELAVQCLELLQRPCDHCSGLLNILENGTVREVAAVIEKLACRESHAQKPN